MQRYLRVSSDFLVQLIAFCKANHCGPVALALVNMRAEGRLTQTVTSGDQLGLLCVA